MDGQAIKVLLIEDNPGDVRLIREMLAEARGRRFNLRCCDCLSAGLRHLTKENIDIIAKKNTNNHIIQILNILILVIRTIAKIKLLRTYQILLILLKNKKHIPQ